MQKLSTYRAVFGLLCTLVFLAACGAATAPPAPTATPEPQPTAPPAPTATPEPQPTAPPAPTAAPEPAPAGPVTLRSGTFGPGIDEYSAEGTAALVELPEGGQVIQLSGFETQWAPDLFVYLSEHPAPRSADELNTGAGGVEVARLRSHTEDEQTYGLPADLDTSVYQSVVIYCRAFTAIFSTAEL